MLIFIFSMQTWDSQDFGSEETPDHQKFSRVFAEWRPQHPRIPKFKIENMGQSIASLIIDKN